MIWSNVLIIMQCEHVDGWLFFLGESKKKKKKIAWIVCYGKVRIVILANTEERERNSNETFQPSDTLIKLLSAKKSKRENEWKKEKPK